MRPIQPYLRWTGGGSLPCCTVRPQLGLPNRCSKQKIFRFETWLALTWLNHCPTIKIYYVFENMQCMIYWEKNGISHIFLAAIVPIFFLNYYITYYFFLFVGSHLCLTKKNCSFVKSNLFYIHQFFYWPQEICTQFFSRKTWKERSYIYFD